MAQEHFAVRFDPHQKGRFKILVFNEDLPGEFPDENLPESDEDKQNNFTVLVEKEGTFKEVLEKSVRVWRDKVKRSPDREKKDHFFAYQFLPDGNKVPVSHNAVWELIRGFSTV